MTRLEGGEPRGGSRKDEPEGEIVKAQREAEKERTDAWTVERSDSPFKRKHSKDAPKGKDERADELERARAAFQANEPSDSPFKRGGCK